MEVEDHLLQDMNTVVVKILHGHII